MLKVKSLLDTAARVSLSRWVGAVLISMLVFAIIWNVLELVAQFIVHTLAYQFSSSYRSHVEVFGGYGGYLQTQLLPRILYGFTGGWYSRLLWAVFVGLTIFIIMLYTKRKSPHRFFMLSILFIIFVFISMRKAYMFVRDPVWSAIDILLWLICFLISQQIFQHYLLSGKEETGQ